MFSKIEYFYNSNNVYKTVIITGNDDSEFNTIESYLYNNHYTFVPLKHIEHYYDKNNIDNIIIINNFKNDENRILLMSYSTWYFNKHIIKHLTLDNNLFIIGNVLYENSLFISKWIYNLNPKTFYFNLFDNYIDG